MTDIVAITQFYNEEDNVRGLVGSVMSQSVTPDVWILMDDGSTDYSRARFIQELGKYGIQYYTLFCPKKEHPDVNSKGVAWQNNWPLELETEYEQNKYLLKIDADTRLPKGYIEKAVTIMDDDPEIGCFSGQIEGETERTQPCGTGKLVRWCIVKKTADRYWDLDPDTLWNIIATVNGHTLMIGDESFNMRSVRPSGLFTAAGRYIMGQRMAYVRANTFLVLGRILKALRDRTHAGAYLRGYLKEWLKVRDRWRNKDPDVKYFYSLRMKWDQWRKKA